MIKHKLSLCSQKIYRYADFRHSNTGNLLQAYDSRLLVYYEFSHPAAPNEAFSSAGILQGMTGFKFHPITPAPHIIGRPRSKCHYYQLLSSPQEFAVHLLLIPRIIARPFRKSSRPLLSACLSASWFSC